jgi:hypothetical protein
VKEKSKRGPENASGVLRKAVLILIVPDQFLRDCELKEVNALAGAIPHNGFYRTPQPTIFIINFGREEFEKTMPPL